MKEGKKSVVFGICTLVILSTTLVAGQKEEKKVQYLESSSPELSSVSCSNATIVYELRSMAKSQAHNGHSLSRKVNKGKDQSIRFETTFSISEDELTPILEEIDILWKAFRNSKNPSEKMSIFNEILQIERDAGLLPPSFTLENINETGKMLSNMFSHNKREAKGSDTQDSTVATTDIIDFGEPFIGFGTALFVIAPFSQVFPIHFGLFGSNVTSKEIPIFENNTEVNFSLTIFAAWLELLIGHAALELWWAISFLPPNIVLGIGPFYSMWGLVGGISLTVYMMGPPIATLVDICIWGGATTVILPFYVEDLGSFGGSK